MLLDDEEDEEEELEDEELELLEELEDELEELEDTVTPTSVPAGVPHESVTIISHEYGRPGDGEENTIPVGFWSKLPPGEPPSKLQLNEYGGTPPLGVQLKLTVSGANPLFGVAIAVTPKVGAPTQGLDELLELLWKLLEELEDDEDEQPGVTKMVQSPVQHSVMLDTSNRTDSGEHTTAVGANGSSSALSRNTSNSQPP
jgi:hypothetical protein